ncbi:uncharacterized protein LOC127739408 [Mytilus californianus]|uniref:uncharacterized protein LOC127739408 n=1 Tax=Mytilus californianus TaxID=6549 RepID=UPI002245573E|nr:uncharacterized protein LOC127739408 [Mytilus californianus]XP_052107129.1 uncharacterized protein LOC127739408 [Mytilus californianus]
MKTEIKAMKRKFLPGSDVFVNNNCKMANARDPVKKKCDIDDNITSHGASKVVAVELNKKLPKAKENEQDSMPSDDEDGYPDLHLDPDVIAQRKRDKNKKENIEMSNS